jgi:hypothetical protein
MALNTQALAIGGGGAARALSTGTTTAAYAAGAGVAYGLTFPQTPTNDDQKSGDKEQLLFTYAPGSRVSQFDVEVTGAAFQGKLSLLKGVKVLLSPVVYDATGSAVAASPSVNERAFIVDFMGVRSLLSLQILANDWVITLALSWMGTEFASKALYPVTDPTTNGRFLPKENVTGTPVVNFSGIETSKLLVQVRRKDPRVISMTADLRVRTTFLDETNFSENCQISTATYPSNVKASLNGRLPFWAHPGVLSETVKLTGLVEDLNVLLRDATSAVPVKLLLTTDTPGVLKVNAESGTNMNMSQSASARWGGQESIDVSLRAAEGEPFAVSFPTTEINPWLISRLVLNLSGRFPPWRAYSAQDSDLVGQLGMKVCARFSVARRCDFSQDGELFGFSILLRPSTDGAELMLEVAAGKDGEPVADKSLAAENATLEAATAIVPRWFDVLFASSIKVGKNQELWLTLKAKKGSAEWCGVAAPANSKTTTLYSDEGGAWQSYPAMEVGKNYPVAQMRVLRRPFVNENDPLLQISWETVPPVFLDLTEETKSVELSQPPAQVHPLAPVHGAILVPLSLTASASGSITVKGATAFYKEQGP